MLRNNNGMLRMGILLLAVVALGSVFCAGAEARPHSFDGPESVMVSARPSGDYEVLTDGGKFEILDDTIRFSQRIGKKRMLASISGLGSGRWSYESISNYEKRFTRGSLVLTVHGDSVMRIHGATSLKVRGEGKFDPEYRCSEDASVLFADNVGGIAIYGPRGTKKTLTGMETSGAWSIYYPNLTGNIVAEAPKEDDGDPSNDNDVLVSVFPPRPFDWEQGRKEKIVHFFPAFLPAEDREAYRFDVLSERPCPTKAEIDDWSAKGFNVLVLHMEVWWDFGLPSIMPLGYRGYDSGARPRDYSKSPVPLGDFTDCITHAHRKGMKVLLYTSPFYLANSRRMESGSSVEEFMADGARHILTIMSDHLGYPESANPDGLYWDGNYMGVEKAWKVTRLTRQLLGDKLLYIHNTMMPFWNPRMVCPFVDTYADYTLRGEGLDASYTGSSPATLIRNAMSIDGYKNNRLDPLYDRYTLSGYNMGNQIGTLCYERIHIDESPIENGGITRTLLGCNARIPYWPGYQRTEDGGDYFLYDPKNPDPVKHSEFWGDEVTRYFNVYDSRVTGITGEDKIPGFDRANKTRASYVRKLRAELAARRSSLEDYIADRRTSMGTAEPEDLAAFKPTTCSFHETWEDFTWEPHKLGPVAEYATDRNPKTYWRTENLPQWLEADLGSVRPINRIVVNNYLPSIPRSGRYSRFKVQISVDGVTYSTVGEKKDESTAKPEGLIFDLPTSDARYVRVLMLSVGNRSDKGNREETLPWAWGAVSELECYTVTRQQTGSGVGSTSRSKTA